jgi:AcrR family transcriptional regulator
MAKAEVGEAKAGEVGVPLAWVRAPQQARSQKTLERLLDAAEALLIEGGVEAVTVPAVVKRSRASVGAFYARFPDKKALLDTLHERACRATVATADQALDPALWEGRSLDEILEALVAFAVRVFGARRTVMGAFQQALGGDPAYARRRAQNGVALTTRALRLLGPRLGEIRHPAPEVAVAMVLRVLTATLEQRNALAASGVVEVEIDDATLAGELLRLVRAYLGLPPGSSLPRREHEKAPARRAT